MTPNILYGHPSQYYVIKTWTVLSQTDNFFIHYIKWVASACDSWQYINKYILPPNISTNIFTTQLQRQPLLDREQRRATYTRYSCISNTDISMRLTQAGTRQTHTNCQYMLTYKPMLMLSIADTHPNTVVLYTINMP